MSGDGRRLGWACSCWCLLGLPSCSCSGVSPSHSCDGISARADAWDDCPLSLGTLCPMLTTGTRHRTVSHRAMIWPYWLTLLNIM